MAAVIEGQENDSCTYSGSDDEILDTETEREDDSIANTQNPITFPDGIGNGHALMYFIKGNAGTGIFAMGILFKYAGLWLGLAMLAFSGFLNNIAMHTLSRVTGSVIEKHDLDCGAIDYTESVFYVFKYGPVRWRKYKGKIKHCVNALLILTQIGFCCTYILFVSQNVYLLIRSVRPETSMSLYLTTFIIALLLCPLSLIRNAKVLSNFSVVANICTVIGLLLTFSYLFMQGFYPWTELSTVTSVSNLLISLSISLFSFEGISLVLPIKHKMRTPQIMNHPLGVINIGILIIVMLCMAFGFFAYLTFGDQVQSSVTFNLPDTNPVTLLVKPLFAVALFISYLIQFYVPAIIFGRLMEKIRCHREGTEFRRKLHLCIMPVVLIFFTYAVAMFVPHLDLMLSLLGALSSTTLALMLPSVLEVVHLWPDRETIPHFTLRILVKNGLFILFWAFAFIGGTVVTLREIVFTFLQADKPNGS